MVQVGNEITNGAFGLYTGRNGGGDWSSLWETADGDQVAKYLEAGSSAVRKADPTIKIAVQLETPEITKYRGIMTVLKKNNVDYDYLGTSYYPFWSTKQGNGWYDNVDLGYGASTPTNLEAIEKMAWNEFGKKTVVLESGWLNNTNDADGTHNSVGEDNDTTNIDRYSADPQGQVDAISDMYKSIIAQNGIGAFYWEPAWIPVKAGWDNWQYNRDVSGIYGTGWASQYAKGYSPDSVLYYNGQPAWGGSSWDNISLFDDHGHPLQSLMMYKGFLNGYQSPANVTSTVTPKLVKLYGADGVSLKNGLQVGQTLDLKDFLNKDGQSLLNGVENTTISEASLKAIFNDLQDGLKSGSYSDNQGNTYHYEFWLDGSTTAEKLANFLAANKSAKYGNSLTVNYSGTLVQDKKNVVTVTSPIKATISKVWGIDGVTIDQPLSAGDSLPTEELKQIETAANKALTGNKGEVITSASFTNLSKSLPGVTSALSGTKVYTTADGNQYHYEYWLTTQDIAWANKNAKYGDPINLTYSASLKWIDPKTK
jgi:arabinogalactan endo-1,4-beta-galactosidase